MKKFKRKNRQAYFEDKNYQDDKKNHKKNALKFAILLVLVVIIVGIGFYYQTDDSASNYPSLPSDITVNVTDAAGQMPEVKSVGGNQSSPEQPAQNPSEAATVEDLGGDNNHPAGIEQLLEGKEIEIKK